MVRLLVPPQIASDVVALVAAWISANERARFGMHDDVCLQRAGSGKLFPTDMAGLDMYLLLVASSASYLVVPNVDIARLRTALQQLVLYLLERQLWRCWGNTRYSGQFAAGSAAHHGQLHQRGKRTRRTRRAIDQLT